MKLFRSVQEGIIALSRQTAHSRGARRFHVAAPLIGLLYLLTGPSPARAHDFWVQPSSFWLAPRASTPITLQVGHGPFRQRSPIPITRIVRFVSLGPDGATVDRRGDLHLGGLANDGELSFPSAGVQVLVLETDNRAQSHLPAIRYTDYLKVEGLTPALEERERTHTGGADGREIYSRRAKALIHVGPADGKPQPQVTKPVGLPLEIVPERDPYALHAGEPLPVRVIYEGHPLAGALVKLTNLEHDAAPLETHLTDRAGRAAFATPRSGSWLLNVIWTKPVKGTPDTEFETTFSSLSFGFPSNR